MPIARVVFTMPSKTRVGVFPCIVVIASILFVFFISFGNLTYNLGSALTSFYSLNSAILNIMVIFAPPVGLLYCFIVTKVRQQLNHPQSSPWNILHAIFFLVSFFICIYYIFCFPSQTLSFVVSLAPNGQPPESYFKFLKVLEDFKNKNAAFFSGFNATTVGGKILYLLVSWAFVLEVVVALLFTASACSRYGERHIVVGIKSIAGKYSLHVDNNHKLPVVSLDGKPQKLLW